LGAIAILGAMGLEHLPRWREHERAATSVLLAVIALQVIILATVVYPAYATTG
jgi:hypothetical protein